MAEFYSVINVENVIEFYEYFYRKKYWSSKTSRAYSFLDSKSKAGNMEYAQYFHKVMIDIYGDAMGQNLLYNYFLFQYHRWEGKILDKRLNSKITPNYTANMLLNQKAIDLFVNRNSDFDYTFLNSAIITTYGFKKSDLVKPKVTVVDNYNDPQKAMMLNTEEGFRLCIEMTSLYHHGDRSCRVCIYGEECKKLLKVNYPKIYAFRGYEQ